MGFRTAVKVLALLVVAGALFFGVYRATDGMKVWPPTFLDSGADKTPAAQVSSSAEEGSGDFTASSRDDSSASSASGDASSRASSSASSNAASSSRSNESSANKKNVRGIDVSESQGEIDWKAVAADGVDFVFVRIGYRGTSEGGLFEDARFKANLAGARAAGISCGAYFYSQAIDEKEARQEAEFVIKALNGTKLDYPVAFDYEVVSSGIETRVAHVNSETATKIADTFCVLVENAGYDTMIYGNAHDLAHFRLELLGNRPVWYAEYSDSISYKGKPAIWQYSCTGRVDGIATDVDLNLGLGAE